MCVFHFQLKIFSIHPSIDANFVNFLNYLYVSMKATLSNLGFPDSSAGKESVCNEGDPGLIPGLGRPPGEGKGYPLQYSWASLMAPTVKNPPTMQES